MERRNEKAKKLRHWLIRSIWILGGVTLAGLLLGGFFALKIYKASGFRNDRIETPADIDESGEYTQEQISRYVNSILVVVQNQPIDTPNSTADMVFAISFNALRQELTCAAFPSGLILGGGEDTMSGIYSSAGPKELLSALNKEYSLSMKSYICMDTSSLAAIIDLLGGIKLNLSPEEADYINEALSAETPIDKGEVQLNGIQSMVHALDARSSGRTFSDVRRRLALIDSAFDNMRATATKESMLPLLSLVAGTVRTNLDTEGLRGFAYDVLKAEEISRVDMVIPDNRTYDIEADGKVTADAEKNGQLLRDTLYGLP